MSEVRAPPSAAGLCADHAVSTVFVFFDFALICGFEKTWPSRARIELCRGVEQRLSAADAVIGPRVFCLPVLAGKSGLSPRLARHMILLRGELLFPLRLFLFHLFHFFCHECKSSSKKFVSPVFQLIRCSATEKVTTRSLRQSCLLHPSHSLGDIRPCRE